MISIAEILLGMAECMTVYRMTMGARDMRAGMGMDEISTAPLE